MLPDHHDDLYMAADDTLTVSLDFGFVGPCVITADESRYLKKEVKDLIYERLLSWRRHPIQIEMVRIQEKKNVALQSEVDCLKDRIKWLENELFLKGG
jgi:polyhydroxyalkanoate synthesis regulator phasin